MLTLNEKVKWNIRVINIIGNNILNGWFWNNLSKYRSSSAYNQLLIAHIMSKVIFMKYLPPARPKMVSKLKMLRIYWKLVHVVFWISKSRFRCQKLLITCLTQIGPKIKSAQNLLKFGTFDILNTSIPTLMSKMIFIKYLSPARPKLVPKSKMLRIYWNLAHLIFRISQSWFWCQKLLFIKYLPIATPKLVPKWKMLRIYWNLIKIFHKNYFWH